MHDDFYQPINFLLIIIIFGSLIMVSYLLISNTLKVNKKANKLIGTFLFLWSTFWMEEILVLTHSDMMGTGVTFVIRSLQFLTPVFFYFGTAYYTNPDYRLNKTDAKYFVLFIIYLIGLIVGIAIPENAVLPLLLNVITVVHAVVFTLLSYRLIQRHKKKIDLFASNTEEIDLRWLEYIIFALLAMVVFIGLYNAFFPLADLNLLANFFSLIIIYFVATHAIGQKEIFVMDEAQRKKVVATTTSESPSEKRKLLSDEDLAHYKEVLLTLMRDQQPYLNPELSLLELSSIMNMTPHQLSYLINEGFNENFFTFVNKYRVEKVKEYLGDSKKKNLAILGMAFESGFNSKTSFYTTFKKITSMTPSEYLKKSSGL